MTYAQRRPMQHSFFTDNEDHHNGLEPPLSPPLSAPLLLIWVVDASWNRPLNSITRVP